MHLFTSAKTTRRIFYSCLDLFEFPAILRSFKKPGVRQHLCGGRVSERPAKRPLKAALARWEEGERAREGRAGTCGLNTVVCTYSDTHQGGQMVSLYPTVALVSQPMILGFQSEARVKGNLAYFTYFSLDRSPLWHSQFCEWKHWIAETIACRPYHHSRR